MPFDLFIQGRKTVKLQLFINNKEYTVSPIFTSMKRHNIFFNKEQFRKNNNKCGAILFLKNQWN